MKRPGSTRDLQPILVDWSTEEGSGIPSVEVKFVEIGRNTGGESGSLVRY